MKINHRKGLVKKKAAWAGRGPNSEEIRRTQIGSKSIGGGGGRKLGGRNTKKKGGWGKNKNSSRQKG